MNEIELQIESLVDTILSDYQKGRDIDKMDLKRHPDKEVVIDMIGKLLRIVYPGYTREKGYRMYNTKHSLSMLMEDVMYNLNKQITLILQTGMDDSDAKVRAQEISLEFFRRLPQVRATVQTDVEAAYAGDPAATSTDEIIFCYPGLYAITVYRLAHVLYELQVPMLPRIMTEYAHGVTGIDIHPGATIGYYFFIDHGTGIVIGEYVKIYQGVTLGGLSTRAGQGLRGKKRHPTIEDNVTIYASASILGGETVIGRDSVIGANAFITHSIPEGTTVSVKSQELQFKQRNCAACPTPCENWNDKI